MKGNVMNQRFSSWEEAVMWLREQPDHGALVQDAYYDDPLISAAERYWSSEEWTEIRNQLGLERGAALDVGAGRGIASYALAKEGYSVTALEPDLSSLVGAGAIRELSEGCDLAINVVVEFSENLPFDDNQFDVVFARAVLHHTNDLRVACKEFHRVLRPGGKLIAVREHVISKKSDLPKFLESHPLHKLYGGEHAYLIEEYVEALHSAGFCNINVLKPFDSVINFAPFTESTLKAALVGRIGAPPWAQVLFRSALNFPGAWPLARAVLSLADNRPGRLYSFTCERS